MTEVMKIERIEPLPPQAVTPMEMIDRAISSGANVETLEKLLALQERWEANQGRKAFDHAIAAAKAEIPSIRKNRTVDFTSQKGRTHYRHEDLAEIARTVDPILSKHGLSYRYRTAQDARTVTVTCILSHRDGYSEETTLSAASDDSGNKNHIQAVGSAATYLQRYTLKMAIGLAASDDDDGKAADGRPKQDPMSQEDFTILRERIDAQGVDAAQVEDFLAKKFGVDSLHELTRDQQQAALSMIRKREQARVVA